MSKARILAATIAAIVAPAAQAADFQYGVAVGIGNSDNIRRVPTAEESETIATAGLDLRLLREGSRLDADVTLDLSYFDYQDGSYDSEVTGLANIDLNAAIVPGRFEWMLVDNFGQSQLDPFAVSTPENRENINYFTTGPDFTMRLGSVASATLFGRWSATNFEDSAFDDERLMGGLSVGRELSNRSEISVNVTTEAVEFDDPLAGSDFDRHSAFLRYDVDGARTRIGLEAGYTEIDGATTSNNSPLFGLDLERDLSERSTLSLSAGVRSSDSSAALRAGGDPGGGLPGQISTGDPFETRHASLGWQFRAQRTEFSLSAGWLEDVYETLGFLDRTRHNFRASARRQLTPRMSLSADAAFDRSEFDIAGQDDEETQVRLRLSWNAVGRLHVEIDAEHFSRDSTNALTEFDETRAFLRFAWRSASGGSGDQ